MGAGPAPLGMLKFRLLAGGCRDGSGGQFQAVYAYMQLDVWRVRKYVVGFFGMTILAMSYHGDQRSRSQSIALISFPDDRNDLVRSAR